MGYFINRSITISISDIIKKAQFFFFVLLVFFTMCALCYSGIRNFSEDNGDFFCLSLGVLSRNIRFAISEDKTMDQDLLNLCGINYLEGYIIDPKNKDIILLGKRNPNRPNLHLDDLIVNVCNIWNGDVPPYCSLDPREEDIIKVQRLFTKRTETKEEMRVLCRDLAEIWGPQNVVVGGVPKDSRHAHVMIDADYHMKKVSQGLEIIPGITSYLEMSVQEYKRNMTRGDRSPSSDCSLSRFWFSVKKGYPQFKEDEGIVRLSSCPVIVLTEKQKASYDGRLYDVGGENKLAQKFTVELSNKFNLAASHVPVYADLENLYRLNAILLAIHYRQSGKETEFSLDSFMTNYDFKAAMPMDESLDGLVNFKEIEEENIRNIRGEKHTYSSFLVFMVCGGVDMGMKTEKRSFLKDVTGDLNNMRQLALLSRPDPQTLFWGVGKDSPNQIKEVFQKEPSDKSPSSSVAPSQLESNMLQVRQTALKGTIPESKNQESSPSSDSEGNVKNYPQNLRIIQKNQNFTLKK